MSKIFISYRRQDSEGITGRIFDRLIVHYGKESVFRDIEDIPPGIDFRKHIGDTLQKAGVLIAIVGPNWLGPLPDGTSRIDESNDPVRVEIEIALRRRLPVIPVLVGDTRMPAAERLPPGLIDFSYRNAIRVDPGVDFDHHMERLLRAIGAILSDKTAISSDKTKSMARPAGPAVGDTGPRARQKDTGDRAVGPPLAPSDASAGVGGRWKITTPVGPLRDKLFGSARARSRGLWLVAAAAVVVPLVIFVMSGAGIRLWSNDAWESAAILKGHVEAVTALAFSPDGTRIVSGSADKSVRVWQADSGQAIVSARGHTGRVTSVVFTPDAKRIASAGLDGTIVIVDAETGQQIRVLRYSPTYAWERSNAPVWSIAMSPDGMRVAAGTADAEVRIWDMQSPQQPLRTLRDHADEVQWVAFLPDGKRLLSASKDGVVKVWETESGSLLRTLTGHALPVAISADGSRLASFASNNRIEIWDTATWGLIAALPPQSAGTALALSADGRRLASTSADGAVRIWDGQKPAGVLSGHTGAVRALAFSPDGQRLASGSDDTTIRVWTH